MFRHPSRAVAVGCACLVATTAAAGEFGRLFHGLGAPLRAVHREPPPPPCPDAFQQLADRIDWLEHHLDTYGSIVAKEPDVWGQNRLMRHRVEYEEQMRLQLTQFSERTSAALRRSDQSFLGMALALQSASGRRRMPPDVLVPEVTSSNNVVTSIQGLLPTTNEQVGRADAAVIARTPPLAFPQSPPGFRFDGEPLALEPTTHVDQLSRYLNHLHALRRINEGDDSADAPGYALNLVRIPVSITPGEHTCKGHGAEITITADPCLGPDLLPTTFRNLVINDLVDVIAPALTWCVNDPECIAWAATITAPTVADEPARQGVMAALEALTAKLPAAAPVPPPVVRTRRARMPIPFSQLAEVSGTRQVAILIRQTHAALAGHAAGEPCIPYTEVRSHLAEELEAAADFLAQESLRPIWDELPGWQLAALVRGRRTADLATLRCRFFSRLGGDWPAEPLHVGGPLSNGGPHADHLVDPRCCGDEPPATAICATTTAVLAWGILLESGLLDERLREDMRQAASAGGLCDPGAAHAPPFFGPDPAPEARQAFNDYVRRRWPIRIFALDPVREEQNVDDSYSRRRELQIAMALATASGPLNAQALARYTRRLETDLATVALNQTAVGFAHGSDTFGWRFYPRVQSPPTRGTLATLGDSIRGGPTTDGDLRQRQLEPGLRECTAIIVMPSFVPAVTFDVRTHFFALVHPRHADPTMRQTLELSRSVQAMRQAHLHCSRSAHLYRSGEFARLQRSVDQLDRRLPLQTLEARIPYENTAGGFELFNTGVSDLAPELVGWYGGPGIDPAGTTTLFLIGKGFSVHDTRVIAGGRPAAFRLVSRDVLEVEIPPGVQTQAGAGPIGCGPETARARPGAVLRTAGQPAVAAAVALVTAAEPLPPPTASVAPASAGPWPSASTTCGCGPAFVAGCGLDCNRRESVEVHLATPYGVSSRLFVPVARRVGPGGGDCRPAFAAACTIDLTFTIGRVTGSPAVQARVDEFFTADCEAIAIRVPESFIPPAKAELGLTLRDARTGETAAVLAFPNPFFDARQSRYVITAGDLRNFVGDTSRPATDKTLRGAVKPWLDTLLARGGLAEDGAQTSLTATASIIAGQQEVPVDGGFTVRCTRRGRTSADVNEAP